MALFNFDWYVMIKTVIMSSIIQSKSVNFESLFQAIKTNYSKNDSLNGKCSTVMGTLVLPHTHQMPQHLQVKHDYDQ